MSSLSTRVDSRLWRYIVGICALYVIVSGFGVTTSHISAIYGRIDERAGTLLGEARVIRSDEFLRGSPRLLAELQGISQKSYTPLDVTGEKNQLDHENGLLGKFLYVTRPPHDLLIGEIAKVVPLSVGFSLTWWLWTVTLLIVTPVWFRQIGLAARIGVLAAVSLYGCTVNSWFSNLPVFLLSNALLGSSLTMFAFRLIPSTRIKRGLWFAVAATSFYAGRCLIVVAQYPPWGIPVLILVGGVTSVALIGQNSRRELIYGGLVIGGLMLLVAVLVYRFNSGALQVALDTVYPGKRRAAGGSPDAPIWAGASTWFMQSDFARQSGLGSPEQAWGPLFLVIPSFALCVERGSRGKVTRLMLYGLIGVGTTLLLVAWSSFAWPEFLRVINPLVWVPGTRAAQISGVVALLTMFLVLGNSDATRPPVSLPIAVMASLATVAVIAPDTERMRINQYIGQNTTVVTVSLLIAGLLTMLCLRDRTSVVAGGFLALATVASTVLVNPLTVGVGPFQDSEALRTVQSLARETPGDRWATTGFYEDTLIIGSGVPQLSGQQPLGPSEDSWRILDPEQKSRDFWNRGQAYVNFQWSDRPDIAFTNPSPDVIQVLISPCNESLSSFNLRWVVTPVPISLGCLAEPRIVTWMGAPLYIYERQLTQ